MTMRCEDALKAMHEILDGDAPESLVTQVTAHTRACTSCARAYEQLLHCDQVLREPDADEPDDAYFHTMAREISFSVAAGKPRPAPAFALSWSFASAMAAACLVFGLGIGHFGFPRTITQTRTVVERVPGPVREVERVVREEVRVEVPVEVVRWRTRTVTKIKRVPAEPVSARATYAAKAPAPPPPSAVVAEAPDTPTATPAVATAPPPSQPAVHGTYLAALYTGPAAPYADRGLSREEVSALARRLSDDMGRLDEALGAGKLASALVSDIEVVDAEIERAITSEDSEADSP